MPVEIYISRFSNLLDKEIPISIEDWKHVIENINGVKFSKNSDSIIFYSPKFKDWIPLFWLSENGQGSMREEGFYQDEASFFAAIKIAKKLKAIIHGEEVGIIYHPNFGVLADEIPEDSINLNLDQLSRYISLYGFDHKHLKEFGRKTRDSIDENSAIEIEEQKSYKNKEEHIPFDERISWQKRLALLIILLLFIALKAYLDS